MTPTPLPPEFYELARAFDDVESNTLASALPSNARCVPSPKALTHAQRLIGAVAGSGRESRVFTLALKLDRLREVDQKRAVELRRANG